jgi:hypothetical protein
MYRERLIIRLTSTPCRVKELEDAQDLANLNIAEDHEPQKGTA